MKSSNLEVIGREENDIEIKHWDCLDCPPVSSWPLGPIRSSQNFCPQRERAAPARGTQERDGFERPPAPRRAVWQLGTASGPQPGELPAEGRPALALLEVPLALSYRKRKGSDTAIFCWPIGGALQLVFCLQRAFVSSLKQALSYC